MIESQRTIGKIVSKYSVLGFAAVIMVLTVTLTLSPSQKVWAIQISNDNITIIKQTNPDGSPDKFNFTSTLGNFTLSDGQNKTFSGLLGNGATYNFTEMVPPDWNTTVSISCNEGLYLKSASQLSIQLPGGSSENVFCTFLNEHLPPGNITISKVTVLPGNSQVFNFTGDLGNFTLSDGQNITFAEPDGNYTVNELVPPSWNTDPVRGCSYDGLGSKVLSFPTNSSIAVKIVAGSNISCKFINYQNSTSSVTVIKHILGGPATLENITLMLNGNPVVNGTAYGVTSGVQQNVTETYNPPTLSSLYSRSFSGDCNSQGVIEGESVTIGANLRCVITDNFTGAYVTVIKHIIGGPATLANITLKVDSQVVTNGTALAVAAGHGLISVTETYNPTSLTNQYTSDFGASCEPHDGTIPGALVVSGAHLTCTITDTFIPPTVKVVKHIVGGPATLDNITLALDGSSITNGTTRTVTFGQQNISESYSPAALAASYNATFSGDCVNGIINSTQVIGGAKLTCAITDTFNATAKIIIEKDAIGGNAQFNFTTPTSLSGVPTSFSIQTTNGNGTITFGNLTPGGSINITETNPSPNYQLTNVTCTNLQGNSMLTVNQHSSALIGLDPAYTSIIKCNFVNTATISVSKNFTETNVNFGANPVNLGTPIPKDSSGNYLATAILGKKNTISGTNPGQLYQVATIKSSGDIVKSLRINDTLPINWNINPSSNGGSVTVLFMKANSTTVIDITKSATITIVQATNPTSSEPNSPSAVPAKVSVNIANIPGSAAGQPLGKGDKIFVYIKIIYGLKGYPVISTKYPITSTANANVIAYGNTNYTGTQLTASGATNLKVSLKK